MGEIPGKMYLAYTRVFTIIMVPVVFLAIILFQCLNPPNLLGAGFFAQYLTFEKVVVA